MPWSYIPNIDRSPKYQRCMPMRFFLERDKTGPWPFLSSRWFEFLGGNLWGMRPTFFRKEDQMPTCPTSTRTRQVTVLWFSLSFSENRFFVLVYAQRFQDWRQGFWTLLDGLMTFALQMDRRRLNIDSLNQGSFEVRQKGMKPARMYFLCFCTSLWLQAFLLHRQDQFRSDEAMAVWLACWFLSECHGRAGCGP